MGVRISSPWEPYCRDGQREDGLPGQDAGHDAPPMYPVLPRWSPDGSQILFMASLPVVASLKLISSLLPAAHHGFSSPRIGVLLSTVISRRPLNPQPEDLRSRDAQPRISTRCSQLRSQGVYPHRFNGRTSILYGPGVRSYGNLYSVTTTLNPSYVPAILCRINPETGAATKIVNLVGSNTVMGLAFARDGKYATRLHWCLRSFL